MSETKADLWREAEQALESMAQGGLDDLQLTSATRILIKYTTAEARRIARRATSCLHTRNKPNLDDMEQAIYAKILTQLGKDYALFAQKVVAKRDDTAGATSRRRRNSFNMILKNAAIDELNVVENLKSRSSKASRASAHANSSGEEMPRSMDEKQEAAAHDMRQRRRTTSGDAPTGTAGDGPSIIERTENHQTLDVAEIAERGRAISAFDKALDDCLQYYREVKSHKTRTARLERYVRVVRKVVYERADLDKLTDEEAEERGVKRNSVQKAWGLARENMEDWCDLFEEEHPGARGLATFLDFLRATRSL